MKQRLLALSLLLSLPTSGWAQAKRVPVWPSDFDYKGSFTLPLIPSTTNGLPSGDTKSAFGLAVRVLATEIHVFTYSWVPQTVLEWRIPWNGSALTSATATFVRNIGRTGHNIGIEQRGLYWDEPTQRMYAIGASVYDSDPAIYPVLNRNSIDERTGRLVTEGRWTFDRRKYPYSSVGVNNGSDKMMMGGLLPVPQWWRDSHGGGRLAGGFGGYESAVTIGGASMGPALAQFDPPENLGPPIIARALLGFPYAPSPATAHRATRSINFINDWSNLGGVVGGLPVTTGENWPRTVTTWPGYWTIGDHIRQGMAAIETATISGLVNVEQISEGRVWYGCNACSPPDGTKASINSTRMVHQIRVLSWDELGYVAFGGQRQDDVHGVISPLVLPGIAYPLQGLPTILQLVAASAFEPSSRLFLVMVQDTRTIWTRPTIYVWQVRDGPAAPVPVSPLRLRLVA